MAILLFSCTLALHARQVDVKLRLDYLWAAQARGAPLLPWGGMGVGGPLGRGVRRGLPAGRRRLCGWHHWGQGAGRQAGRRGGDSLTSPV